MANDNKDYDVIVIGGGLLGCFAARNLARYDLKVALLEKREDVCLGVSRANTAIIYSGCDTKPGSVKTEMCVKASQGFNELCDELEVKYSNCGSIMISFGERGKKVLDKKLDQAIKNGVPGAKLLSREEVLALEPNIAPNVYAGLYVPGTGTVMPWELCIAAAENAAANCVRIFTNFEVTNIARCADGFIVETDSMYGDKAAAYGNAIGDLPEKDNSEAAENTYYAEATKTAYAEATKTALRTRSVVNCAGLNADAVLEKAFDPVVRIVPDAGDYFVLDTKAQGFIKHVIFHEPEEKSKGLTLVPTVEGNILVGPTEREIELRVERGELRVGTGDAAELRVERGELGFETEIEGMELLRSLVREVVPSLPMEHVIRSFGAVRPNPFLVERGEGREESDARELREESGERRVETGDAAELREESGDRGVKTESAVGGSSVRLSDRSVSDFCIVEAEGEAFISFVGVKTPGLTCANELGMYAANWVAGKLNAAPNHDFNPRRAAQMRLGDMSFEEREAIVRDNPDYGRIVCRCKGITEGEVLDAIRRQPGAVTLDGVKHRAGTGLGRCQGGFCTQRIVELLARELGGKPEDYL